MNDVINEVAAKKNVKRNPDFLKTLKMVLESFESGGELESALLYLRFKDGTTQTSRSYSEDPESDAAALLVMAFDRLGFSRD